MLTYDPFDLGPITVYWTDHSVDFDYLPAHGLMIAERRKPPRPARLWRRFMVWTIWR